MREAEHELPSLAIQAVGCGGRPPCMVLGRGFTCRVKYRKVIDKSVDRVGINGNIKDYAALCAKQGAIVT